MKEEVIRLARYLAFKFDCLREQEEYGIKLDTYNCNKYKNDLEYIIEEKKSNINSFNAKRIREKLLKQNQRLCISKMVLSLHMAFLGTHI